jgi:hypothetical protein
MKPTTLSFLVGHLQKAPPFTATTTAHHKCAPTTLLPCSSPFTATTTAHHKMRTNNASSLLLPIHSVHLQQHLVATALNEIVISLIWRKAGRLPAAKHKIFKTHCGLGRANSRRRSQNNSRVSESTTIGVCVCVCVWRVSEAAPTSSGISTGITVDHHIWWKSNHPALLYNHGLKLHDPFVRAGLRKWFSLKIMSNTRSENCRFFHQTPSHPWIFSNTQNRRFLDSFFKMFFC